MRAPGFKSFTMNYILSNEFEFLLIKIYYHGFKHFEGILTMIARAQVSVVVTPALPQLIVALL